jgi:hypothetical protein
MTANELFETRQSTILASLISAADAKTELADATKEPKKTLSGSMMTAVITAVDLTKAEWKLVAKHLTKNGVSVGAKNMVARFTSENVGHENLKAVLKGCKDDTLKGRIEHLAKKKLHTFGGLRKECIPTSEEGTDKRLITTLVNLSLDRYNAITKAAKDQRMDKEKAAQAGQMSVHQGDRDKLSIAKGAAKAMKATK